MAQLLYLGRLAEVMGCAGETLSIGPDLRTAGELLRSLGERQPALCQPTVKIAINRTLANDDQRILDSDEIAFLPPVSGG